MLVPSARQVQLHPKVKVFAREDFIVLLMPKLCYQQTLVISVRVQVTLCKSSVVQEHIKTLNNKRAVKNAQSAIFVQKQ